MPYLPQLRKLLFLNDKETFKGLGTLVAGQTGVVNIFKVFQSLLYVIEMVETLTDENKKLKTSKEALSTEVTSLKGKLTEFEALTAERKALLESKEADAKSLQSSRDEVGVLRDSCYFGGRS